MQNNLNDNTILSAQRTALSNIRTILSFFTAAIACISLAFAFMKLHEQDPIDPFTLLLFIFSGVLIIAGIIVFIYYHQSIRKIIDNDK